MVPVSWLLKRDLLIFTKRRDICQSAALQTRSTYKYVTEPVLLQRTSVPLAVHEKFCVIQVGDRQQPRAVNVSFSASASAAFIVCAETTTSQRQTTMCETKKYIVCRRNRPAANIHDRDEHGGTRVRATTH